METKLTIKQKVRGLLVLATLIVGILPLVSRSPEPAFKSKGPKPFERPQEAARRFMEERLAPGAKDLPLEHLWAERDKLRIRQKAVDAARSKQAVIGNAGQWQPLGPGNIGGRTRAIVVDPTNPDTMFAAGVAGGVWKSTDGGGSWNSTDDMMLNLAVSALAMDPLNPNVLYAGTGEGYFSSDTFVRGLGIFKTTDGGTTWTQLPGTVNGVPDGAFHYVNKIRISPNNANRVYAATRTGVWRSDDAGQNWFVVLSNPTYLVTGSNSNGSNVGCTDLAIRNDRNPDVLFATFGSFQSDGFFRSSDNGLNWLNYGVPPNQGRTTIALAPSDNNILYLMMADNGSVGGTGQLVNIYRSDDGADSFTAQVNLADPINPWLLSNVVLATGCVTTFPNYSQGWYDNIIAVDPVDPDIVWVGGVGIFRSDDAGQNFGLAGYWFTEPPTRVHADKHEFIFHPDYNGTTNQIMYVGNDGGVYRTTNARAATSREDCPFPGDEPLPQIEWESLNNGYGVTQFYHGDAAKQSDLFIGGTQDNGTPRVQSDATPDQWEIVLGGDGGYAFVDPTDSQIVYAEGTFFPDIQKSTDGGATFQPAVNGITDTDGIFITPFVLDQNNPNTLWTGGRRPWRTTDGADSWQVVGPDFAGPQLITAYGIFHGDSNVMYLGFNNGYVVKTTNALSPNPTYTIYGAGNGLIIGGNVSSVAVSIDDPNVAYCTYSNYGISHILKTVNGGSTWFSIDGVSATGVPDIPVHWIEPRPGHPGELYVGTELGVFRSLNDGGTWEVFNTSFPNTVVESLDFKDEDTLVAFTHGRGAFMVSLVVEPPGDIPAVSTWGAGVACLLMLCMGTIVYCGARWNMR